jgi:hypothetical protein
VECCHPHQRQVSCDRPHLPGHPHASARFDSTELPGVRPTIGYINLAGKTPEEIGAMIVKKLGR